MNEQRIREIANQSSTYAEDTVEYYSGIIDGLTWEAKILKARDLKFAELIIQDCVDCVDGYTKFRTPGTHYDAVEQIKANFGIKE